MELYEKYAKLETKKAISIRYQYFFQVMLLQLIFLVVTLKTGDVYTSTNFVDVMYFVPSVLFLFSLYLMMFIGLQIGNKRQADVFRLPVSMKINADNKLLLIISLFNGITGILINYLRTAIQMWTDPETLLFKDTTIVTAPLQSIIVWIIWTAVSFAAAKITYTLILFIKEKAIIQGFLTVILQILLISIVIKSMNLLQAEALPSWLWAVAIVVSLCISFASTKIVLKRGVRR